MTQALREALNWMRAKYISDAFNERIAVVEAEIAAMNQVPEGWHVVEDAKTWEDLKDGDVLCGLVFGTPYTGSGFPRIGGLNIAHPVINALLAAGNRPLRKNPEPVDTLEKVIEDLGRLPVPDVQTLADRLRAIAGRDK